MRWQQFHLDLPQYLRTNENIKMPTSAASSSSLATSSSSLTTNGNSQLSSTDYMIKEAERFESFYKDVLKFHDLLENIDNILLRRQLREIINKIEGMDYLIVVCYILKLITSNNCLNT